MSQCNQEVWVKVDFEYERESILEHVRAQISSATPTFRERGADFRVHAHTVFERDADFRVRAHLNFECARSSRPYALNFKTIPTHRLATSNPNRTIRTSFSFFFRIFRNRHVFQKNERK